MHERLHRGRVARFRCCDWSFRKLSALTEVSLESRGVWLSGLQKGSSQKTEFESHPVEHQSE